MYATQTLISSKVSNTLTVRTLEGRAQSEKDLDGSCLGYFTSMDSSDLSKLTDSLSKDNVSFTAKAYDDIYDMVQDLYDGYIDGILDKSKLSGIGELNFMGCNELILNENLSGYTLMYQAVHGSDDRLPEGGGVIDMLKRKGR